MRIRSGRLLLLILPVLLVGCATPPQHYPSETAARYVGKTLADLEMHWSVPLDVTASGSGQKATWQFLQYNIAGCTVTVHTDAAGVIRKVSWTRGCGPKGTGAVAPSEFGSP